MRYVTLCLTATTLLSHALMAQSTTIVRGQEYAGEVRLQSPASGVSFMLPSGFGGVYDTETSLFLVASRAEPNMMLGVWGFSEGDLEEVLLAVANELSAIGVELTEKTPPTMTENRFMGSFYANTNDGPGVLYAAARRGPEGNSIIVTAFGSAADEGMLRPAVRALIGSASFNTPEAAQWRALAGGTVFARGSAADAYSPGGVGDGSFASQTDVMLDICSNGQYAYEMSSESFISVDGAGSMSSSDSDAHSGQWYLVGNLIGDAFLVLDATDGRRFIWPAAETSNNSYSIDGNTYLAARSRRCG